MGSDDVKKKVLNFIKAQQRAAEELETCEFARYREIIRDLPRPTEAQVDAFVEFVSEAHSWYKHLPLRGPGVRFQFYVDPCSGFERQFGSDGRVIHRERVEGDTRFHYTWMTTQQYRERFGHLAYDAPTGKSLMLHAGGRFHLPQDMAPGAVFGTTKHAYRLPPEVVRSGSAFVTGVIHPSVATKWVWSYLLDRWSEAGEPEFSDQAEADLMRKIRAAVDADEGEVFCQEAGDYVVPGLRAVLKPERERLQRGMSDAIHAMLRLVYD